MNQTQTTQGTQAVPPPTKHQLAVMIWLAVFPTLSVLNLVLSGVMGGLPIVLKTFVMATIAVPIVMYGVMPRLQALRVWVLAQAS